MVNPVDECSLIVSWDPFTLTNCEANFKYDIIVHGNQFTVVNNTLLLSLELLGKLAAVVRVYAVEEAFAILISEDSIKFKPSGKQILVMCILGIHS